MTAPRTLALAASMTLALASCVRHVPPPYVGTIPYRIHFVMNPPTEGSYRYYWAEEPKWGESRLVQTTEPVGGRLGKDTISLDMPGEDLERSSTNTPLIGIVRTSEGCVAYWYKVVESPYRPNNPNPRPAVEAIYASTDPHMFSPKKAKVGCELYERIVTVYEDGPATPPTPSSADDSPAAESGNE